MKRWPAIAALGVMAWPASMLIGGVFVGIVESWKAGYLTTSCGLVTIVDGSSTRQIHHCLRPVTALSGNDAWLAAAIALTAAGLWWAGWILQMRSARKFASPAPSVPPSSLLLAAWFVLALVVITAWAANVHTFM